MTKQLESPNDTPEQELIDYYQSQQMSSDRLHSILEDTQSTQRRKYFGFALAASVALLSVFAFVHQNILASQRTDMVLREAALNHASKLQMDAEGQTLVDLQSGLSELPFKIKLPAAEIFQQLALVGGRYCTISGNLAAHLKLSDPKTSQQYSLFLTPYADNLSSMDRSEVEISGVGVKLWREQDVVYAFAAATDEPL